MKTQTSLVAEEYVGRFAERAMKAAELIGNSKSSLHSGYGIIDTACTKTCIGRKELKEFLLSRRHWLKKNQARFLKLGGDFQKILKAPVRWRSSRTVYKFGAGGLQRADAEVGVPLIVGGKMVNLVMEVLPKSFALSSSANNSNMDLCFWNY